MSSFAGHYPVAQHNRLVREGNEAYMPTLLGMEPTELFMLFNMDPLEMKSSGGSLVDVDYAADVHLLMSRPGGPRARVGDMICVFGILL